MSDTQQAAPAAVNIHPADLPADALIDFDAFAWLLPGGVRRQRIERSARAGNFPAGVRFTPRAKMVWRAGAVAAWLAERTAGLEVSK